MQKFPSKLAFKARLFCLNLAQPQSDPIYLYIYTNVEKREHSAHSVYIVSNKPPSMHTPSSTGSVTLQITTSWSTCPGISKLWGVLPLAPLLDPITLGPNTIYLLPRKEETENTPYKTPKNLMYLSYISFSLLCSKENNKLHELIQSLLTATIFQSQQHFPRDLPVK